MLCLLFRLFDARYGAFRAALFMLTTRYYATLICSAQAFTPPYADAC